MQNRDLDQRFKVGGIGMEYRYGKSSVLDLNEELNYGEFEYQVKRFGFYRIWKDF